MSSVKVTTPRCNFDCEMVTAGNDVVSVTDPSVSIYVNGSIRFVSLSDFRNQNGETIGECLLQDKEFVEALRAI